MNIQYLLAPVDSALCISFLSLLEVPRRKADGRRKTEQTTLGQGREGITSAVHKDAFRQYIVHREQNEFPINKIKVCNAKGFESNMKQIKYVCTCLYELLQLALKKSLFYEMYQAISYSEEKLEKRYDFKLCTYSQVNNLIILFGRNEVKQETLFLEKIFTTEELS